MTPAIYRSTSTPGRATAKESRERSAREHTPGYAYPMCLHATRTRRIAALNIWLSTLTKVYTPHSGPHSLTNSLTSSGYLYPQQVRKRARPTLWSPVPTEQSAREVHASTADRAGFGLVVCCVMTSNAGRLRMCCWGPPGPVGGYYSESKTQSKSTHSSVLTVCSQCPAV